MGSSDRSHVDAAIAHLLAEDDDLAELGLAATYEPGDGGETIVVRGLVGSPVRRDRIGDRIGAAFPGVPVRNEIEICGTRPPDRPEEAR